MGQARVVSVNLRSEKKLANVDSHFCAMLKRIGESCYVRVRLSNPVGGAHVV
jgi:hypothetical protein